MNQNQFPCMGQQFGQMNNMNTMNMNNMNMNNMNTMNMNNMNMNMNTMNLGNMNAMNMGNINTMNLNNMNNMNNMNQNMMGNFMQNQLLFNPNIGMQNTMMNNQFQNNFYNNNMNMGNNINMNMMNNMNMNQNNMNFNGMMDMNANNLNMNANNNINFNNINNNAQNDEQQKAQALALLKKKEAEDRKKLFSEIINKESGENLDKINTISDMSNMAAITRNYIEVDSAQNPNKYLPIGQALNSPDQDYLILGILADYLQKQGVITAIEKRDQNQLSKEKLKEIDTFLQFLINGLTNLKKHELRFDFGWERNNLI